MENAAHVDDDPEWLPPEDLTDDELGVGRPVHPYGAEVARRREQRARERWRYLADDPLPGAVAVTPAGLGTVLRALRWKCRLNQRELAAAVGVPRSAVGRLEAPGESDLLLSTLVRMVAACGLRLAVVDEDGTQLAVPFEQDGIHDGADRVLPAHLQTFDPTFSPWWGDGRYQRSGRALKAPRYASRGRPKAARRRPSTAGSQDLPSRGDAR